jgi:hypothetical protein
MGIKENVDISTFILDIAKITLQVQSIFILQDHINYIENYKYRKINKNK